MGHVTFLVACGLTREARIIERMLPGSRAIAGGGDAARLEAGLAVGADARPAAILSCGLAGALDPLLRPGEIVLDGDPVLVERLRIALPHARIGRIVGQDRIVPGTAEKRALRERTGAAAVDMETHVAARVAARLGLPFAAVRAISDAADEELPPAALVGMRPDGGVALGAVLASLVRRPGQLPALIRTGRHAGLAFRNLGQTLAAVARAGVAP